LNKLSSLDMKSFIPLGQLEYLICYVWHLGHLCI
jgi:hypothetical protein